MPSIVQFRRGTQTQNNNFLGAAGELSVNTTSKSLRVHDGSQTGGYELARADLSNLTSTSLSSVSIGNTQVISNTRQLQNISGIDTTTKNTLRTELVDNLSSTVNVNTTGIITAKSFYGSGIGLTSIPAGQLTGALPAIDGSALTNIVATSSAGNPILIDGSPIGTATTIDFKTNFYGTFSGGIATVGINTQSDFSIRNLTTSGNIITLGNLTSSGNLVSSQNNSGLVGTSTTAWGDGYFQNFNISGTLNVRTAIDLEDSDILRFGTSDDAQLSYNGASNKLILDLQTDCIDFVISSSSIPKFTFNKTNGRLGIGSDTPAHPLDVSGNINSTGTVSASNFDSTSDISLKTNISKIDEALNLITKIDGVRFDWISDGKPSMGVIAQNIESVAPELVSSEEIKRVNYNGIIAILIEAVKELKIEVDDLKSKIA